MPQDLKSLDQVIDKLLAEVEGSQKGPDRPPRPAEAKGSAVPKGGEPKGAAPPKTVPPGPTPEAPKPKGDAKEP
jgi:hypothetical protein